MCGIVGSFSFQDDANQVDALGPLVAMMQRRGPDDEGTWTDGARCALGFRRLSILDLSRLGHQPMATPDGRYHLIFNGEIYNYRELRADLEARGYTLRSTGDAETLLAALAEWGPAVLSRINGMYALGCYDSAEQRLLLARDHAGIKPLHYAVTPRGVVFGSQYDQLVAHPWLRNAVVDEHVLGMYMRFGFIPAPYGLHKATAQLEPGQWIEFSTTGACRRGRSFILPAWQPATLSGDEAVDAFEDAFARATSRHLISDVQVGVLLSGGIDSPLVAAEARRQHGARMPAFTISFDDPTFDESSDAAVYAKALDLDHHIEHVGAANALALLDDVVRASTEPTADSSMFPTLLVSRLARSHVKVVLSGDGGDELYWGYPSRFASTIGQARYFGWPRAARYAAIALRRGLGRGHATRDILNYSTIGSLYQRKHTGMAEADLARVFPQLPALPTNFTAFDYDGFNTDQTAQWLRWNEFNVHLQRVLAKVDRASMHCSLEVRVPLLDREVIQTAWKTDWRSCIDLESRLGKRVLRQALARRTQHQRRNKRGFAVPMPAWITGPLRPLLQEYVLDRTNIVGIPLNHVALRELVTRLDAGDGSKAWGLWMLLSLALWSRQHLEGRSP